MDLRENGTGAKGEGLRGEGRGAVGMWGGDAKAVSVGATIIKRQPIRDRN